MLVPLYYIILDLLYARLYYTTYYQSKVCLDFIIILPVHYYIYSTTGNTACRWQKFRVRHTPGLFIFNQAESLFHSRVIRKVGIVIRKKFISLMSLILAVWKRAALIIQGRGSFPDGVTFQHEVGTRCYLRETAKKSCSRAQLWFIWPWIVRPEQQYLVKAAGFTPWKNQLQCYSLLTLVRRQWTQLQ